MFSNEVLNKCQNDKNILLSYQKTICLCMQLILKHSYANRLDRYYQLML